jgi:hypothetical protein
VKQAQTAPFSVTGASPTVTRNAASTSVAPASVIVDYTNMSGATLDWISIATNGSADTSYSQWFFTNGNINGSGTFSNVPAGTWVLRGYFNNTYVKEAQSASFIVN